MKSKTQWYELTNCMNNKNLQQLRKLNLIDNGIVDLLVLLVNGTLQLEVEQRLDTSWMEIYRNILFSFNICIENHIVGSNRLYELGELLRFSAFS